MQRGRLSPPCRDSFCLHKRISLSAHPGGLPLCPFYPNEIHKWLTPALPVLGASPPSVLINMSAPPDNRTPRIVLSSDTLRTEESVLSPPVSNHLQECSKRHAIRFFPTGSRGKGSSLHLDVKPRSGFHSCPVLEPVECVKRNKEHKSDRRKK
jgi:hypothetical protein